MPLEINSSLQQQSLLQESRSVRLKEDDERPPRVPPKSPRTESRASPRIKQMPHSASSSTSTTHSTSSSGTSTNNLIGKASPKSQHNLPNTETTNDQQRFLGNGEGKASSCAFKILERLGRQTPPLLETSLTQQGSQYNAEGKMTVGFWAGLDQIGRKTPPRLGSSSSQQDEVNQNKREIQAGQTMAVDSMDSAPGFQKRDELAEDRITANQAAKGNPRWHQRGFSEASVIDRGRPMKRGNTSLLRKFSKPNLIGLSLSEELIELPTGILAREASDMVPNSDLETLKQEAIERAESFEVLSVKDVSNLSKVN